MPRLPLGTTTSRVFSQVQGPHLYLLGGPRFPPPFFSLLSLQPQLPLTLAPLCLMSGLVSFTSKDVLCTYYMPGPGPGAEHSALNKTDTMPARSEFTKWVGPARAGSREPSGLYSGPAGASLSLALNSVSSTESLYCKHRPRRQVQRTNELRRAFKPFPWKVLGSL